MKILVIGAGGRENAICWSLSQSNRKPKLFCANGNAGIAEIAECVAISPTEITKLVEFAISNTIDLTIVGGETSLALGIVDEFKKHGLRIVGASGKAAQLEASKAFAKDFMARHSIPTANYANANSVAEALEILQSGKFGDADRPIVIKADGLAAGKGVVMAKNRIEAIAAIQELEELVGKEASSKIVLEETLIGHEVSLLLFSDGNNYALMPPVRDHKRIGEGDTGANTGGMGTICTDNLLSKDETVGIIKEIILPTLKGAEKEGFPFRGILFLGLMMTANGAKLLEYNVRFGDPETQAILVRLETDFVDICEAIINENLDQLEIKFSKTSSACVILASKNYPSKPLSGDEIFGLENIVEAQIFHSGTSKNENGKLITSGGRVLGVTATAVNLEKALEIAYQNIEKISWEGMQYRRDIGK